MKEKRMHLYVGLSYGLFCMSYVLYVMGQMYPVFEYTANIEVLRSLVLTQKSNMADTIRILLNENEILPAVLLILFSFVLPITKFIVATLGIFQFYLYKYFYANVAKYRPDRSGNRLSRFGRSALYVLQKGLVAFLSVFNPMGILRAISKYQLTDSMMAFVMVAFLNQALLSITIEEGGYFFWAYCILSLISTQLLSLSLPNLNAEKINSEVDRQIIAERTAIENGEVVASESMLLGGDMYEEEVRLLKESGLDDSSSSLQRREAGQMRVQLISGLAYYSLLLVTLVGSLAAFGVIDFMKLGLGLFEESVIITASEQAGWESIKNLMASQYVVNGLLTVVMFSFLFPLAQGCAAFWLFTKLSLMYFKEYNKTGGRPAINQVSKEDLLGMSYGSYDLSSSGADDVGNADGVGGDYYVLGDGGEVLLAPPSAQALNDGVGVDAADGTQLLPDFQHYDDKTVGKLVRTAPAEIVKQTLATKQFEPFELVLLAFKRETPYFVRLLTQLSFLSDWCTADVFALGVISCYLTVNGVPVLFNHLPASDSFRISGFSLILINGIASFLLLSITSNLESYVIKLKNKCTDISRRIAIHTAQSPNALNHNYNPQTQFHITQDSLPTVQQHFTPESPAFQFDPLSCETHPVSCASSYPFFAYHIFARTFAFLAAVAAVFIVSYVITPYYRTVTINEMNSGFSSFDLITSNSFSSMADAIGNCQKAPYKNCDGKDQPLVSFSIDEKAIGKIVISIDWLANMKHFRFENVQFSFNKVQNSSRLGIELILKNKKFNTSLTMEICQKDGNCKTYMDGSNPQSDQLRIVTVLSVECQKSTGQYFGDFRMDSVTSSPLVFKLPDGSEQDFSPLISQFLPDFVTQFLSSNEKTIDWGGIKYSPVGLINHIASLNIVDPLVCDSTPT